MTPTRPLFTKGVAAATLLLLVSAPAGAATSGTTYGTASTTSVPLHVTAAGVPVDIGATVLTATTDTDTVAGAPWSAVALTLANIDGTKVGEVGVASDGTTSSPGDSIAESTPVGDIAATVGNVLALADDSANSATAALTTLSTSATVLNALDLEATLTDVVASVDDTGAASVHSLAVTGLDLDLANVLGTVLDTLPLEDLLALAGDLGIDTSALTSLDAAADIQAALDTLTGALGDVTTTAGAVESAAQALDTADGGTTATLEGFIATLGGLTLPGDLAAFTAIVNDALVAASCAGEVTVAGAITCIQGLLDAHLLTLGDEVLALEGAVTAYDSALSAVLDAATALGDAGALLAGLVDDLTSLLDALLAAPLLGVGDIDITQQVRAVAGDLDASSASHTCATTAITPLTGDAVEVLGCDGSTALDDAIALVTGALTTVFETVGGVDAGSGIALELFGTAEDTVSENSSGVVTATSNLEVLSLTIPDVTVTPCDIAGGIACSLGIDLDSILGTATTTLGTVLSDAQATASGTLGTLGGLLTTLGSTAGSDVTALDGAQATVSTALSDVQALVDGLDLSSFLAADAGDVTVPGAMVVVDPVLVATHGSVAAAADPNDPADPAPADPSDPTLPNTGGGAALLAVLTLGAGAWLWRRREA